MMDKIYINDLEVFAKHGVFPEENVLGQKFVISAVLFTDTRKAGKSDSLEESIDYGEISHFINQFSTENTFKLLETLAERLAEELLWRTEHLRGIRLMIKKPWAPVGLPLDTAAVEIERWWHTAYVALGSNMGDTKGYLDFGVKKLNSVKGCRVEAVSDYIVTKPYGGVEQDDFLNGMMRICTTLTPEELLESLHGIEAEAERKREIHWGPRTLDLDIILYDDLVLDSENLSIPHIEMHKRDFVLKPLCQIAPYVRHPIYGKTALELLQQLMDNH